jgi:hypothetical protein
MVPNIFHYMDVHEMEVICYYSLILLIRYAEDMVKFLRDTLSIWDNGHYLVCYI